MAENDETAGTASDETRPGVQRGLTRGMRFLLIGVAVVVVAGIGVSIALFALGGRGDGSPGSPGSPGGTPAAGTQPTGPSASDPSAHPPAGPVPDATPTTGSEVLPPRQTDPGRIPPRATPTPLVKTPLPPPASAQGRLVDGFPTSVMGPIADSDIISSSISTEGKRMQVTLVARTDSPQDDVVEHYRTLWSGLGLSDAGASGTTAASFSDAFNTLSLGFSGGTGTGTLYSIYAVLEAN